MSHATAASTTTSPSTNPDRVAIGPVKRLAYAAVFAGALGGAVLTGGPWMLAGLLAPDLALLTSLSSLKDGRLDARAVRAYNAAHSLPSAIAVSLAGIAFAPVLPFGLLWLAHIAMDRTVGYGPRAVDGTQRGY